MVHWVKTDDSMSYKGFIKEFAVTSCVIAIPLHCTSS